MMKEAGVHVQVADQCMYGLKTWGDRKSISTSEEAHHVYDEL